MSFLFAGIGYGGSCFPKDVQALARLGTENDCPADILAAIERVNSRQKILLANRVITRFGGTVRGMRFALWGVAFKPNTDDIREAPALTIIKRLTEGGAAIQAYDPEAMENASTELKDNALLTFAPSAYAALDRADALLLATEWRQFRQPDFERMKSALRQPIIFDGRNQYPAALMERMGFEYHCIGRAALL